MNTEHHSRRELCGSCVYAADCPNRARSDGPVFCCDRFLPLGGGEAGPEASPRTAQIPVRQAAGLCGTCAGRDECKRRYVESGVFRCADYR